MSQKKKTVDEYLSEVDYHPDPNYKPTTFALDFVNFIKLVNGADGEENKTPVFHLKMLDSLTQEGDICNLCFRGSAKTTLFCEYGILYTAVYGVYPGFKGGKPADVSFIMYVSDSIENGVKNLRKNVEFRYENQIFLRNICLMLSLLIPEWSLLMLLGISSLSLDMVLLLVFVVLRLVDPDHR